MDKQEDCSETIEVRHPTLDPDDWDGLAALGHRMLDETLAWLAGMRERPAWQPMPAGALAPAAAAPVEGDGAAAAYEAFLRSVRPYPLGNVHPRFWAWVVGTGSPFGMLAEMLAAALNSNCGGGDHAGTRIEEQVLAWAKEMVGFPPAASGLLVSGASIANLVGLTVARSARAGFDVGRAGLQGDHPKLTLYASTETHMSVRKAVALLGLGTDALCAVPVTADFEIDLAALARALAADRAAGRRPIAVIANAGTVNTGAVDPLDALADLCAREELWLHVDGAIGAPLALLPAFAPALAGMGRADSLAFDYHKWLYVPYDAGCVLVRDAAAHRRAFSEPASYLARNPRGLWTSGSPAFSEYGPELSRPFRALKIWMALQAFGTARHAACIERNLAQARLLARLVEESPDLELLAPVPLNIVCFRFTAPGLPPAALDRVNREILMQLQEDGVAVVLSTTIHGRLALRAAITNHRSRDQDFELLAREVAARGRRLLQAGACAMPP